MTNLSQVLSLLSDMKNDELSVVIATSQSLRVCQKGRKPPQERRGPVKRGTKKNTSTKPSVGKTSAYADVPEYQAFKVQDRLLKKHLKKEKLRYSEFRDDHSSDPALWESYFAASRGWYRRKALPKGKALSASGSAEAPAKGVS